MPRFFFPSLALAAMLAVPAVAQKFAVINMQRAVLETAEIKKAAADLEAKYRPQQQEIERRTKELQQIQEKIQNNPKITPQESAELQAEGQRKQRALQRLTEDLQADVDRERTDILNKGGQRMTGVVAKLAQEKGLDVVIEAGNAIFVKPAMDITSDAIAAYDKQYPLK
ncbi:MAG: OmpH family outer membrane protein [Acidobacteria bacterium]|nr:OmpH family outer membrane protein [Acidobacteriota bacterium]